MNKEQIELVSKELKKGISLPNPVYAEKALRGEHKIINYEKMDKYGGFRYLMDVADSFLSFKEDRAEYLGVDLRLNEEEGRIFEETGQVGAPKYDRLP